MKGVVGAVYDPPREELPHVAVIFKPDGEVLVARTVPSAAAGEALIGKVLADFAEQAGIDLKQL